MWTRGAVFFLAIAFVVAVDHYAAYYEEKLSSTQYDEYVANGLAANCTIPVADCDLAEQKRIGGTCNNLKNPSVGGTKTPQDRILPPKFNIVDKTDYRPRLAKSGKELPSASEVQRKIVPHEQDRNKDDDIYNNLNHLAAQIYKFVSSDLTDIDDTQQTFQNSGCCSTLDVPSVIVRATPIFDLSPVYGNVLEPARRANKSGLLATETINGRIYPTKAVGTNILLGTILYWRFHNYVATQLAEVNPCWTDDQLFNKARDITIAVGINQYFYELLPNVVRFDDFVYDGFVTKDGLQQLESYYDQQLPKIFLEYSAVLRTLPLFQDEYLKQENSNNVDPVPENDILYNIIRPIQTAQEMTNELEKQRLFGFPPYIEYVAHCSNRNININTFDDLEVYMRPERIQQLKDIYEDVADIDLLAGIWAEKLLQNSLVTSTSYCIIRKQMLRTKHSDRHWFEDKFRPYGFTEEQMEGIRSISIARMLCDVGDSVEKITPQAFKLVGIFDDVAGVGSTNDEVNCDDIQKINYFAWQDDSCPNAPSKPPAFIYDFPPYYTQISFHFFYKESTE